MTMYSNKKENEFFTQYSNKESFSRADRYSQIEESRKYDLDVSKYDNILGNRFEELEDNDFLAVFGEDLGVPGRCSNCNKALEEILDRKGFQIEEIDL